MPSHQSLTLVLVEDSCTNRSNAIAGTWWLDDCKSGPCYGDIDPGTYGTEYFLPGMQSPTDWVPTYGALQFTTTGSWSVAADVPTHLLLVPQTQYEAWTPDGAPAGLIPQDIFVFVQPRVVSDPSSCPETPVADERAGRSVADLLTYLRSVPDLTTTGAGDITIDGHLGKVVDLQLKASSTACGRSEELLVTPFGQDFAWYTLGLQGTQRTRLILLDLGPGSVVGIAIEGSPESTDTMLRDAMPIVQSFRFK